MRNTILLKNIIFFPVVLIWLYTFSVNRVLLSLIGSIFFALLEMSLYKYTVGHLFTTKEQFIANLLCIPFMIEDYNLIINNVYIRLILFPFNVWFFEIIMGFYMIFLLGKNPAWKYATKYSIFDGLISLDCYPRWFLLGLVQEFLYFYIFNQITQMLW
jgi:hypothetical protein